MVGKNDITPQEITKYLQELGLDPSKAPNFTAEQIKKAYKKRALETHPDRGGDKDTFMKVNHAYLMLTDPEYRHREQRSNRPHLQDIEIKVGCSFEDAFFGNTINLAVSRLVVNEIVDGQVNLERLEKDGKTKVETITVSIDLPKGCNNGHREIRKGKGLKVGDYTTNLVIFVVPEQRAGIQIQGIDVITHMEVPLHIMIKGGKIDVMTMYGLRKVWVPPGSAPGSKVRLSKCGVDRMGDQYVILMPIFPSQAELKKKEWKKFGINWEEHNEEIKKAFEEEEKIKKDFYKLKFNTDNSK